MKTCGYCGNEYDDKEAKCPQCGATLLKHTKGAESAAAEHERLAEEIKNKRKKRSKLLGVGIAAIILIVIIIISNIVSALNDPQRAIAKESKALLKQAEEMIAANDYDSAISILNQISTEWEDYSETRTPRKKAERGILMNQIAEYQTSGNYEELIVYIEQNVTDMSANIEIQAIYEEAVDKIKENTLSNIAAYTEENDYLGAIEYISSLGTALKNDADINAAFNTAVANYEAEVITNAEAFAQAGDYTSARSALSVAENYIGWTSTLADKVDEINEREVITQVLVYAEAENYADAIIYLNEKSAVVSTSADLQEKQAAYIEKYRANVINNAASEYKANGYEAAVSVLNSALGVLPNDEQLNSEKVKYELAVPVPLIELDVTKQGEYLYVGNTVDSFNSPLFNNIGELCKDINGNQYSSDGVHYVTHFRLYEEGEEYRSITYYLNQEYDVLTGMLYRPYITLHCNFDWTSDGRVDIYGDGVLLYSASLSQNVYDPIEFEVDITGVRELQIRFDGKWRNDEQSYFMPKICLANLKVAKKP